MAAQSDTKRPRRRSTIDRRVGDGAVGRSDQKKKRAAMSIGPTVGRRPDVKRTRCNHAPREIRRIAMLFMVMHKIDPKLEDGSKPDPKLIEEMGQLIGEAQHTGIFHNAAGLKPSSHRVRLNFKNGKRTLTKGPLRGDNELVAGFAMLKVKSMDEAIEWASRYAAVSGDAEIEIGPLTEPWDLGIVPKPAGELPLRVLALHKADAKSEAGQPPSAEMNTKMNALLDEMKTAGVFMAAEGLQPSSRGARLRASSGKQTWTDGPFTESKELVSGFTIIKVNSLEEAKAWATRYAKIIGTVEVDVREVYED
jgi:hypothetical protein